MHGGGPRAEKSPGRGQRRAEAGPSKGNEEGGKESGKQTGTGYPRHAATKPIQEGGKESGKQTGTGYPRHAATKPIHTARPTHWPYQGAEFKSPRHVAHTYQKKEKCRSDTPQAYRPKEIELSVVYSPEREYSSDRPDGRRPCYDQSGRAETRREMWRLAWSRPRVLVKKSARLSSVRTCWSRMMSRLSSSLSQR